MFIVSILLLVTLLYLDFITVTIILVHRHVRTVLHFRLAHLVVVHLLAIVKQWTVMLRYAHKILVFFLEHLPQPQTS